MLTSWKLLCCLVCCCFLFPGTSRSAEDVGAGPWFHQFRLTLEPGERTEAFGPFFYSEERETFRQWAIPPLFSSTKDAATDYAGFDFLYPVLTYDRFGSEKRFQFLQVFSFSSNENQAATNSHRFTLFPLYFQQRSDDPAKNYTAFVPFYGNLQQRLFRDEIRFVMFPLYLKTRKKDVVTDNYLWPIFHLRHGDNLQGWQFWPLVGHEHKDITTKTNNWGDTEFIGGHDKSFWLWPIFLNQKTGIGTTNQEQQQAVLPFYSLQRSPLRDSTTAPWPLGFTYTDDREKKYREWGAPWPFIVFARGEGKTANRVWPIFGQMHNQTLESDFYLWPLYKHNSVHSEPLDRERTRILFFLYSDLLEKNTASGAARKRRDLWPLFTYRQDFNGNERLQLLAPLEPLVRSSQSIERNYSPLWSIWRSEKNPSSQASSQSLLWNLYRCDRAPGTKKCSLLFGLFQYQSTPDARRMRLFFIPVSKKKTSSESPTE